jgi:hypothetical protein
MVSTTTSKEVNVRPRHMELISLDIDKEVLRRNHKNSTLHCRYSPFVVEYPPKDFSSSSSGFFSIR